MTSSSSGMSSMYLYTQNKIMQFRSGHSVTLLAISLVSKDYTYNGGIMTFSKAYTISFFMLKLSYSISSIKSENYPQKL